MNKAHAYFDQAIYKFVYKDDYPIRAIYAAGSRISTKTRSMLEALGKATFYSIPVTIVIFRKKSTQLIDMANDFLDQMSLINLGQHFKYVKSEQTIYNMKTGRRIRLKGLYNPGDNKINLTGLNFNIGEKVILGFDESHEFTINDENAVLMAARGGEVFRTYSMNPWSNRHWLVSRIATMLKPDFDTMLKVGEMYKYGATDDKGAKCIVHWSNWRVNQWKDNLKDTIAELESYKTYNIQRWRTASVGMPGVEGDLVFEHQINHMFTSVDPENVTSQMISIDFGQKRDALSCSLYALNEDGMTMIHNLYWQPKANHYWIDNKKVGKTSKQMTNSTNVLVDIVIWFIMNYADLDLLENIDCDLAASAFISVLNDKLDEYDNIYVEVDDSIKDTRVLEGIDALRILIDQDKFKIHIRCNEPIREIEELQWNYNTQGEVNKTKPFIGDDHSIDEIRYATNRKFGAARERGNNAIMN